MSTPNDTPTLPEFKACTKCGQVLPLEMYHKNPSSKDGRRGACKPCRISYCRERYAANNETPPSLEHPEFKACTGCKQVLPRDGFSPHAGIKTGLQSQCKSCGNSRNKAAHQANPAPNRARARKSALANPDRVREYQRVYLIQNRERLRAYRNEWARQHPDKSRRNNARRAARRAGAAGRATKAQIEARFAMWGGMCWMCGGQGNTTDHVIPLANGGTNWPANLRPACKSCNSRKRTKDWRLFVRRAQ